MSRYPDVALFVLAGGRSSRMGQDKGLVPLQGRPMVAHLLAALAPLALPTMLVAHHPAYADFGLPVLPDMLPGQGPMGGLYTALHHSEKPWVLLLSCDTPFLSPEAVASLLDRRRQDTDLLVSSREGFVNPLMGLYRRTLLPEVQACLQQGYLSPRNWIASRPHLQVPMDRFPARAFLNLNTPQDLLNAMEIPDTIHLRAFGLLAERLGCAELDWPLPPDTDTLKAQLLQAYPTLQQLRFSVAVDRRIVQENTPLSPRQEVALMPPFSGG